MFPSSGEGEETSTQLGPLERGNLKDRTTADPVSKALFSSI
jgi:hypothetical protein